MASSSISATTAVGSAISSAVCSDKAQGTARVDPVVAVEVDAARIRRDQAGDHIENGGLAGSVRSEKADALAAADRQGRALHHAAALVALFDTRGDQPAFAAHWLGLGPRGPGVGLSMHRRRMTMAGSVRRSLATRLKRGRLRLAHHDTVGVHRHRDWELAMRDLPSRSFLSLFFLKWTNLNLR